MTINHRMKAPKEMETPTSEPHSTQTDAGRARMRMGRICATPAEVELYKYSPNAARNNLRPGIPCEYENINAEYED